MGHCVAGIQPEHVFLVVNARSWSSWTIANHYSRLRDIPASNVFALDWPGSVVEVKIDEFRDWILQPILREIQSRKLDQQIRCIVYSADFPYAVSFETDVKTRPGLLSGIGNGQFNVGSITGLTFHHDLVLSRSTNYTSPAANRTDSAAPGRLPPGTRFLSMMLGYTSGRGNSVDEVIRSLTRSRFADGVFPRGTFYFMTNPDVRATTRSGRFPAVRQALQREHRTAEIADGVVPQNRRDVLGLMMGFAGFDWTQTNSRLLPGSICENLTSYGGILDEQAGQTPISEFVRWGAAGTTGTVVEPYAIAAKFPDAVMHLLYARGLTLAESIYGSVLNPYQLLAIGDPLCRPWSNQQPIDVVGLTSDGQVERQLELRPAVSVRRELARSRFELFVDGRRLASCQPNQAFVLNTARIPAGYHEAVVTFENDTDPRFTGRRRVPFQIGGAHASLAAELVGGPAAVYGNPKSVAVEPEGIAQVLAFHNRQLVGQQAIGTDTSSRLLTIDTRQLGFGPVQLTLVGLTEAGKTVTCRPLRLNVIPDQPVRAQGTPVGEPTARVVLSRATEPSPQVIGSTVDSAWLKQAGLQDGEPFTVAARVQAETTGMFQVQAMFKGNLTVRIDDTVVMTESHPGFSRSEAPLCLEKGSHELFVSGRLDDVSLLELRFGHRGARRIGNSQ